jgi:hypothetical protein
VKPEGSSCAKYWDSFQRFSKSSETSPKLIASTDEERSDRRVHTIQSREPAPDPCGDPSDRINRLIGLQHIFNSGHELLKGCKTGTRPGF